MEKPLLFSSLLRRNFAERIALFSGTKLAIVSKHLVRVAGMMI
jgi:hypothetical protein